jgi:hypothetical protein
MDNSGDVENDTPEGLKKKWAQDHKDWFIGMYNAGIKKAQDKIKVYAKELLEIVDDDDDPKWDEATQKALENLRDEKFDGYCINNLEWTK